MESQESEESQETPLETEFTAAGVLPYAIFKRQLYFLLGQERYQYLSPNSKVKSRLVWSDFGGMKQEGETQEQTAAREFAEETLGMFEDPRCSSESIKRCAAKMTAQLLEPQRSAPVFKVSNGSYRQFVARVDYLDAFMFSVASSNTFDGRSCVERPFYAEYMDLWHHASTTPSTNVSPSFSSISSSSMPSSSSSSSPSVSSSSSSSIADSVFSSSPSVFSSSSSSSSSISSSSISSSASTSSSSISSSISSSTSTSSSISSSSISVSFSPISPSISSASCPSPGSFSLSSPPSLLDEDEVPLGDLKKEKLDYVWVPAHTLEAAFQLALHRHGRPRPALPDDPCSPASPKQFLHHKNHVVCHVDSRPLRLFHKFVITMRNLDLRAMVVELCEETNATESLALMNKPHKGRRRRSRRGHGRSEPKSKRGRRGEVMDSPPFFVLAEPLAEEPGEGEEEPGDPAGLEEPPVEEPLSEDA